MKSSDSEGPEYKVGYRKPPLHTRFKKGERRNPRGRPKVKKAIVEIFKKVIAEKVTVPNRETSERMTRGQTVLLANLQESLKGNKSAMANVYDFISELGMLKEIPESKRAYFAVPAPVSEEEFRRIADEANRIGSEAVRQRRERGEDPF
jgi:hypothetical protein